MRIISYDINGCAAIGVVKSAAATDFVDLGAAAPNLPSDMTALLAMPDGLAAAKAAAVEAIFGLHWTAEDLHFTPCLPTHWPQATLVLRRDGRTMH